MIKKLPMVILFSLAFVPSANAQGVRRICNIQTLCPGVQPGGGRIVQCLRAHRDELSERCQAAVGRMFLSWGGKGRQGPGAQGPDGEPYGPDAMPPGGPPPADGPPPGSAQHPPRGPATDTPPGGPDGPDQ